jgi:DNA-binding response OmpR family regulator
MRLLLVEDQDDLAGALIAYLEQQRYRVDWANSAEEAWERLSEAEPDLLILDVMLPEGPDSGFRLAQELRALDFGAPILFLTARDSLEDRVTGLDLGADDYLSKPFALSELAARIRALLRRQTPLKQASLNLGELQLDFVARRVKWRGQELNLTEREFTLLETLAYHPGKVFPVSELLERVFPEASSGPAILRIYVARLRQKTAPELIQTAGGGYRLGVSD